MPGGSGGATEGKYHKGAGRSQGETYDSLSGLYTGNSGQGKRFGLASLNKSSRLWGQGDYLNLPGTWCLALG